MQFAALVAFVVAAFMATFRQSLETGKDLQISCLLLHELIDSYLRQLLLLPRLLLLQHSACLLRRLRGLISSKWAAKLGEDD